MFEALTVTPGSLPIGAFPLLEGIFPPESSDSEKAACLLSLFQMALKSEDECLNRGVDCESFSQTLLSIPDDLRIRSEASGCPHGSTGGGTAGSAARAAQMITSQRANSESVSAQSLRGAAASSTTLQELRQLRAEYREPCCETPSQIRLVRLSAIFRKEPD